MDCRSSSTGINLAPKAEEGREWGESKMECRRRLAFANIRGDRRRGSAGKKKGRKEGRREGRKALRHEIKSLFFFRHPAGQLRHVHHGGRTLSPSLRRASRSQRDPLFPIILARPLQSRTYHSQNELARLLSLRMDGASRTERRTGAGEGKKQARGFRAIERIQTKGPFPP